MTAVKLFLAAAFVALLVSAASTPTLTGEWKGEGQIKGGWTKARKLSIDLRIAPDGKMSGSVGDAGIVSGAISVPGRVERTKYRASFEITLKLKGVLLESDGVTREEYHLFLKEKGATLKGSGESDGGKHVPSASRETRLRGASVEISRLVLEKS